MPSELGLGVYEIGEAARYTRQQTATVRSWFFPAAGTGRKPVFKSDYQQYKNRYAISFLDLIDVLVAGKLRTEGVSMPKVREAYRVLKKRFKRTHPFCYENLYTDGKDILIDAAHAVEDSALIEVVSGQNWFKRVIRPYLTQITFDQDTRKAVAWHISNGVVINPKIGFGRPVIDGTGLSAEILGNQYFANGEDEELVADLYEVTVRDVRNAAVYVEEFRLRAAA